MTVELRNVGVTLAVTLFSPRFAKSEGDSLVVVDYSAAAAYNPVEDSLAVAGDCIVAAGDNSAVAQDYIVAAGDSPSVAEDCNMAAAGSSAVAEAAYMEHIAALDV